MILIQEMIQRRMLGDVFCDNIKSLGSVQVKVFHPASGQNPTKSCQDESRGKIDFDVIVQEILKVSGFHQPETQQFTAFQIPSPPFTPSPMVQEPQIDQFQQLELPHQHGDQHVQMAAPQASPEVAQEPLMQEATG